MRLVAHRGLIESENSIEGVVQVLRTYRTWGVEIDVRFSTNRDVVLCHDRERRNDVCDTLHALFDTLNRDRRTLFENDGLCRREIIVDVNAFGVDSAQSLGRAVCDIVERFPDLVKQADVMLCSFNEYCVSQMLSERMDRSDIQLWNRVRVGAISSGVPLGLFDHLKNIDFVSIDYGALCEDIVDRFKEKGLVVFAWTVNSRSMANLMKKYRVHGIVVDTTSETRDMYVS